MKHKSIDGLVVFSKKTGEHDAYLSILSAEHGRFPMLVKGASSLKSGKGSICQLFTYANFEYYERGGVNVFKDGCVNQSFFGLVTKGYSEIGQYLCELANELSDENVGAEELLRLTLNSLYALSKGLYTEALVKAAFELRAMAISGYEPQLHACRACGREAEGMYLDTDGGTLVCAECLSHDRLHRESPDDVRTAHTLHALTPALLGALRYCTSCPVSRIFAFSLEEHADLEALCRIAESYVLSHLGRGFRSLSYYCSAEDFYEEIKRAAIAPQSKREEETT